MPFWGSRDPLSKAEWPQGRLATCFIFFPNNMFFSCINVLYSFKVSKSSFETLRIKKHPACHEKNGRRDVSYTQRSGITWSAELAERRSYKSFCKVTSRRTTKLQTCRTTKLQVLHCMLCRSIWSPSVKNTTPAIFSPLRNFILNI